MSSHRQASFSVLFHDFVDRGQIHDSCPRYRTTKGQYDLSIGPTGTLNNVLEHTSPKQTNVLYMYNIFNNFLRIRPYLAEYSASRPICRPQAAKGPVSSWVGDHQRILTVECFCCFCRFRWVERNVLGNRSVSTSNGCKFGSIIEHATSIAFQMTSED